MGRVRCSGFSSDGRVCRHLSLPLLQPLRYYGRELLIPYATGVDFYNAVQYLLCFYGTMQSTHCIKILHGHSLAETDLLFDLLMFHVCKVKLEIIPNLFCIRVV